MQEAIIDPKTVDTFIQTIFGSYEKFVLNLIKRRQELADQKQKLSKQLERISKEENLIKDILTGYHGKKVDGLYYDYSSNSLTENKPKNLPEQNSKESMLDLLGQYYALNKEQYGKTVEEELRKSSPSEADTQIFNAVKLRTSVKSDYQENVIDSIQQDYLPFSSKKDINASIDQDSMNKAFDKGLSPQQFAMSYAQQNNLVKTSSTQTVKMV